MNGQNLFVDRNAEATDVVSSRRASARRIGRGEPRGECGRRGELREPGRKRSEAREKGGGRRGEPNERREVGGASRMTEGVENDQFSALVQTV